MKKTIIVGSFLLLLLVSLGQTAYDARYQLKHSNSFIIDKNFYLLTVLGKNKKAATLISTNETLTTYLRKKIEQVNKGQLLLNAIQYDEADTTILLQALAGIYDRSQPIFDELINKELKPSGCYYRFNNQDNKDFFLNCWRETFKGINTIIDHYGFGKGFRYPDIDSASYDVKGAPYQSLLAEYFSSLKKRTSEMKLFYEPSLTIALALMKTNQRHEPANYEPLVKGENKKAIKQIKKTRFEDYKYSIILVPGQGPEIDSIAIDPMGKVRCDLAARRYNQKLAPFIIVSGGNVHPFHTQFTEALEMKKYLMKEDSIPESAIIIEPQARHTTTNFRNAERLMIRYGMPIDKAAICVSTTDQISYIKNDGFDLRSKKELGYLPYKSKEAISSHDVVFYVTMDCLQIDPIDPIDP
jgi:DUF218 domain